MVEIQEITSSDHDILIELRSTSSLNFKNLRDDIKSLTEGTHDQLKDHEKRLRDIEVGFVPDSIYSPAHQALIKSIDSMKRIIYMAMGGWVLLTFIAILFIRYVG